MASSSLYPPVVNNTEPAFVVYKDSQQDNKKNRGRLKIYFAFSAFSEDVFDEEGELKGNINIHVKLTNSQNVKVINDTDGVADEGTISRYNRLRSAGIILNLKPQKDENNNLYYIELHGEDVSNDWTSGEYTGSWIPGWIYKIQLRLSSELCGVEFNNSIAQESWLFLNQNSFSEWSTIVYAKAIPEMIFTLNNFYNKNGKSKYTPTTSSWVVPDWEGESFPSYIEGSLEGGVVQNKNSKEYYKSYRIQINYIEDEALEEYDKDQSYDWKIFEDSGDIFTTPESKTKISYKIKRRLRTSKTTYYLTFSYETINGYIGTSYYIFNYSQAAVQESNLKVYTADDINKQESSTKFITPSLSTEDSNNNQGKIFNHIHNTDSLSIGEDEEEGRVGLKIKYTGNGSSSAYIGNGIKYCIKRASMIDGFQEWTPICYGTLTINNINEIEYDYTIESGVYYKYGLEEVDDDYNVEKENYPSDDEGYVIRVFDHSYLLGEGNTQLKIAYNPSIQSYGYTVNDTKIETIGGQFPFVSRNTSVCYRSFPISSIISVSSDEKGIFFDKEKYYNKTNWNNPQEEFDINSKYDKYAENHKLSRDFVLERDFRKEVLKFLMDGKPKLFKSTTEGNIIVRLTDITTTPTQSLNRFISSFSANASEIDDYNMENCLKYGFYNPRKLT